MPLPESAATPPDQSLRRRLLTRLWMPLAGVLLVGAFLSFKLAVHFGNVVHDRWLLDSALTLASQLQSGESGPRMALSRAAVQMLELDNVDRIYGDVATTDGERLFGNAAFPPLPRPAKLNQPYYYDDVVAGVPVRIVAITVNAPPPAKTDVTIQVAETRNKREALVGEVMLTLIPLQVAMLVAAGIFIWFAVTSSLATLEETATRLRRYEPDGLAPLRDVQGLPSEVQPLIGAINGLIENLALARGAQQRFIANAAHQLRTPLAALQVQTERALRETNREKHAAALADVISALSRMRHLTQQLLTLSRSDPSSQGMLQMTELDLTELARSELEKFADPAVNRNVDLGYEGPEQPVVTMGERQLLAALLDNLVDNAIQYGGAGCKVTVGVVADPPLLYVEDDGPGISPVEREHVFEPFYRPRNSKSGGCGLGLTIAREIAARHGAVLTLHDGAHGRGTRIEIAFPASPRTPVREPAAEDSAPVTATAPMRNAA
jgi:two-component system sensor histidine kinase TctE